jgi:hypothetical protein
MKKMRVDIESIKVAFNRKQTYRRFPTDSAFKAQFVYKNVYNSKIRKYLFDKLENFGRKELVDVERYTLEHIMPQNKNLSEDWKNNLGKDWMAVQDKYLHTVGNLTLMNRIRIKHHQLSNLKNHLVTISKTWHISSKNGFVFN